jgi:hypothetical protein
MSRSTSCHLPPLAAVRQVAAELTVRESMIFLDGREFTGVDAEDGRGRHRGDIREPCRCRARLERSR